MDQSSALHALPAKAIGCLPGKPLALKHLSLSVPQMFLKLFVPLSVSFCCFQFG